MSKDMNQVASGGAMVDEVPDGGGGSYAAYPNGGIDSAAADGVTYFYLDQTYVNAVVAGLIATYKAVANPLGISTSASSVDISHGLNTLDVVTTIFTISDNTVVVPSAVQNADVNKTTVTFASPQDMTLLRAVCYGYVGNFD